MDLKDLIAQRLDAAEQKRKEEAAKPKPIKVLFAACKHTLEFQPGTELYEKYKTSRAIAAWCPDCQYENSKFMFTILMLGAIGSALEHDPVLKRLVDEQAEYEAAKEIRRIKEEQFWKALHNGDFDE